MASALYRRRTLGISSAGWPRLRGTTVCAEGEYCSVLYIFYGILAFETLSPSLLQGTATVSVTHVLSTVHHSCTVTFTWLLT